MLPSCLGFHAISPTEISACLFRVLQASQKSFFFPTFFFWLLLYSFEKKKLSFLLPFSPCWLPFNYLVISSCLSKLEKEEVLRQMLFCYFAGLLLVCRVAVWLCSVAAAAVVFFLSHVTTYREVYVAVIQKVVFHGFFLLSSLFFCLGPRAICAWAAASLL